MQIAFTLAHDSSTNAGVSANIDAFNEFTDAEVNADASVFQIQSHSDGDIVLAYADTLG